MSDAIRHYANEFRSRRDVSPYDAEVLFEEGEGGGSADACGCAGDKCPGECHASPRFVADEEMCGQGVRCGIIPRGWPTLDACAIAPLMR